MENVLEFSNSKKDSSDRAGGSMPRILLDLASALEKHVESVISRNKIYICLQSSLIVVSDMQKLVTVKLNEKDYNDRKFKSNIYLP